MGRGIDHLPRRTFEQGCSRFGFCTASAAFIEHFKGKASCIDGGSRKGSLLSVYIKKRRADMIILITYQARK